MTKVRARENNEIGVSSCRMCNERARNDDTGCGRQDRMPPPRPEQIPGGEEIDQTRLWDRCLVFLP